MKFDPKLFEKNSEYITYLTIKVMTFRKMFCFKFNDYFYYAENHGLK